MKYSQVINSWRTTQGRLKNFRVVDQFTDWALLPSKLKRFMSKTIFKHKLKQFFTKPLFLLSSIFKLSKVQHRKLFWTFQVFITKVARLLLVFRRML